MIEFEIMVSAGEVSGDKNAAAVVKQLKELCINITVWGVGGDYLAEAGVELLFNTVDRSTVGILEPLAGLGYYIKILKVLKKNIKERKPALILLVDFTAFNMRLARFAHELSIPVVSWFSPSAWVWGSRRAKKMADWGVVIASVFEMEHDVYKKAGAEVHFVGHPLPGEIKPGMGNIADPMAIKDVVSASMDKINTGCTLDINGKMIGEKTIVGILPGSRRQEVRMLLHEFLKAAEIIHSRHPECIFLLPAATKKLRSIIEDILLGAGSSLPLTILDGQSPEVMKNSKLILTASGTATLEAACAGTPFIAAYRVNIINSLFIKLFVRVKYMALPNIILGKQAFPEFYQGKANGYAIANAALKILEDESYESDIRDNLLKVRMSLGMGDSAKKTAELVRDILGRVNE